MTVERLLPADALRPRWSSASALVYIGGFVVLSATGSLLGILGEDHGNAALVGYSALATAIAVVLALALQQADRPMAAGVLATLAVIFFAVFVGSLETWIGILDEDAGGVDWQPGLLVLELLTIGAALVALQRFRAPLLMLPIAVTFALTSSTWAPRSTWRSSPGSSSLRRAMRSTGLDGGRMRMWLHLVGGASFGGGVLALVDGDAGWILVGLVSVAYVAGGYAFGRASYAVLGALGILATTTYFIQDGLSFVSFFVPLEVGEPGGGTEPWQIALYYVFAGLLILALGLVGGRFARLHGGDSEA